MSVISKLRCHSSSSSLWMRASSSLMASPAASPAANRSIVSAANNTVNCHMRLRSCRVQNIPASSTFEFDQRRWRSGDGAPDGNIKEAIYTEDQRKQDHKHCVEMVKNRDFEGYCKRVE